MLRQRLLGVGKVWTSERARRSGNGVSHSDVRMRLRRYDQRVRQCAIPDSTVIHVLLSNLVCTISQRSQTIPTIYIQFVQRCLPTNFLNSTAINSYILFDFTIKLRIIRYYDFILQLEEQVRRLRNRPLFYPKVALSNFHVRAWS